jgi:hypothetical protein
MAIQLIDKIRTIVWYESIAYAIDAKNPHEFATRFDQLRHDDYVARGIKNPPDFEMKSFRPYEKGTSVPTKATLHMVESLMPRTAEIFMSGPRTSRYCQDGDQRVLVTSTAPLWLALGGSVQAVRSVLVWYDKELGQMQVNKVDVPSLAKFVLKWLPIDVLDELAKIDTTSNAIAYAHEVGDIKLNFDDLTATVALWRLSMYTQEGFALMSYVMNGLYPQAIPNLMAHFRKDLAIDFVSYCQKTESHHHEFIKRLTEGKLPDEFVPWANPL